MCGREPYSVSPLLLNVAIVGSGITQVFIGVCSMFIKNLFKNASEKHFDVEKKDIGKRRVISIFAEWVMLSWMWSMFYFQYLRGHLGGLPLKAISEKSMSAAVVVAIIIFGIYLIAEYMLLNIARYHVNFVLTGKYALEEKKETSVKKKR